MIKLVYIIRKRDDVSDKGLFHERANASLVGASASQNVSCVPAPLSNHARPGCITQVRASWTVALSVTKLPRE